MAEQPFLNAVAAYLTKAKLSPTPAGIGPLEPTTSAALPAVVLSLESSRRISVGMGERTSLITGALAWSVAIDLASPFLPGDTSFSLLSNDRKMLTLPHGGLVRSGGDAGTLGDGDLTVQVAGTPFAVVSTAPGANQVKPDPIVGQLAFGAALPASGTVNVTYFLGQWEQRVVRIGGTLRVDACGATGDDARALGGQVLDALLLPGAATSITRLLQLDVASVGSVGAPQTDFAGARRQTLRFEFLFENEINRPESSGGVIHEIPIGATVGVPSGAG
jgi:hypothetical protein